MEAIIAITTILFAILWGFVALQRKGNANFWRLLASTNERYGTNFGTSPTDKATLIGVDMSKGGVIAFDKKNRKIALLTHGGKSIEIFNYDFIRSWKISWREKSSAGGAQFGIVTLGSAHSAYDKIFLEISTNDINRPIIKMPMSSMRWAQETSARLEIMINAKR